jgi:hypothetical protein
LKKCTFDNNDIKRSKDYVVKQSFELVPLNATFIFSINTPAIFKKIDFNNLHKTTSYINRLKPYYPQNKPFANVFANPEGCGIDVNKKIVFFVDVGNSTEEIYSASILPLKNSTYFRNMTEKELNKSSNQEKYYKYLDIDNRSLVAWNKDFVIFMTSEEEFDKHKILNNCFNKSHKKYFDSNPDFSHIFNKTNKDLYFWFDMTSYANNQIFPLAQSRKPMDTKYLNDVTYYGNIDFLIGEIEIDLKAKWNKYLDSSIKDILEFNIDTTIMTSIPMDRKISFISQISLNISNLQNMLLSDIKSKLAARNALRKYGLIIEDINDVLSGDVGLISYPDSTNNKSSVLLIFSIKNKKKLQNLLKVGTDMKYLEKTDSQTYILPRQQIPFYPINVTYSDHKLRLYLKNEKMYICGDKSIINYIKSNNFINTIPSYINIKDYIKNGILSIYGTNKISKIQGYTSKFNVESFKIQYNDSLKISVYSNNKNISSLKQLLSIK